MKSSIMTIPEKAETLARFCVPYALIFFLWIIDMVSLNIPYLQDLQPSFTLMFLFYWSIYRPTLLPSWLIFLMGVGPLLPWRSASVSNIMRALRVPLMTAGAVILVALALQIFNPLVLLSVGLLGLVSGGIAHEWVRGTMSRHKRGENYPKMRFRLSWMMNHYRKCLVI